MFMEPPPTRYDLTFELAGIPVRVHPLFWLIALFIGFSSRDPLRILIWIVVVFVSILIHELGHAIAMGFFGRSARIVLYSFGGLTIPEGRSWRYGTNGGHRASEAQEGITISAAGPIAGFLFAGIVMGLVAVAGGQAGVRFLLGIIPLPYAQLPFTSSPALSYLISSLLWVNVFWGLINLLPVFPLDGGSIARRIWVQLDPMEGVTKSLWLSVITGAVVALAALVLLQSLFMALLFGYLAFSSYQVLNAGVGRPW